MPQRWRSVGGLMRHRLAAAPWWVVAAVMALLALCVTLLFRHWVHQPGPGGAARTLVFELLRWGLPALLCLCVLWGKRAAPETLDRAEALHDMAAMLKGLTWAQFDKLVAEAFRQRRFAVLANGENPGPDAVDMVLRKGGETHLVLCKHWRADQVGVQALRDLQLTMIGRSAAGAYVLTSGHFSDDARAFAKASAIHLVEGPRLSRWLKAAQRSLHSQSGAAAAGPASLDRAQATTPSCPKCQAAMIKRLARRGVHAGSTFWSCTRYPRCHGVRPFVAFSGAMFPDPEA